MKRWLLFCLLCLGPSSAFGQSSPRNELEALAAKPEAGPAADLIARARTAFARADRLRGTGDAVRAKLAESSAETWTQAAQALVAASKTRSSVSTLEAQAHAAEERLSRARATLEASFARAESLDAELARKSAAQAQPKPASGKAASQGGKTP